MKVQKRARHLFQRTEGGIYYIRRRIPATLRFAYPPGQSEICRSLQTADRKEAHRRADAEFAKIEEEFDAKRRAGDLRRVSLSPVRSQTLTDEQLQSIGEFWARQILFNDERRRTAGLTDDEFEALGTELSQQRAELKRMLARGQPLAILPALRAFLHVCGVNFTPAPEEARRASYLFLTAVIKTLDRQLERQEGDPVETAAVVRQSKHPLYVVAPERDPDAKTWEAVFEKWQTSTANRPLATIIAYKTPWTDLRRFAERHGVRVPGAVTEALMSDFVDDMVLRLAVNTVNERLAKLRSIFKVAKGKHQIATNPAADTLGVKENRVEQNVKRRISFDDADIQTVFSSEVYTAHKRSQGSAGEATYWLPLLMFYTGARPEEIAGLAVHEIRQDPLLGWYLAIVDRPSSHDAGLFNGKSSDQAKPRPLVEKGDGRLLKSNASIRRVPVAQELIALGLLDYIAWVREMDAQRKRDAGVNDDSKPLLLFPTLTKDTHGKYSGAFSKYFGRHLRALGITDKRKVLYSFRHKFKDLLEAAQVESKYLQRLMGHTTGDGPITDNYGSKDLPFEITVDFFSRVKFPAIPAKKWQPGDGVVRLRRANKG